jgi:FlaA1/EpsC-like NDP-sugar epimerase
MNSLFGRLAAGLVARLSLAVDLLLVTLSLVLASFLSAGFAPSLITFCLTAVSTWLFLSLALRHYDPWAPDRAAFDDAAMTSVLVLAETTVVAVATHVFGVEQLPGAGLFLLVLWPTALLMRFTLFRTFSPRSGPIDEVLVVGTGPLARATAEDLKRRGRHEVIGFVRFSNEEVPSRLRHKVLGVATQFEEVLRTVPVGEVYLASNSFTHADEIQAAIKTCERFGVPFAMPAYMFRLERARPLSVHSIGDGYIHYQSALQADADGHQAGLRHPLSAIALWLLSPLLARPWPCSSSSPRVGRCCSGRSASAARAPVPHAEVPHDG